MRRKTGNWLLAAGLAFIVCLLAPNTVRAASKLKVLHDAQNKDTEYSVDLTGDGKAEKVTLTEKVNGGNDYIETLKIKINGKTALSLDGDETYTTVIQYVKMSAKKEFLQIYGVGDNDWIAHNRIYRYDSKKGKLVSVLSLSDMASNVTKVTGKEIQVAFGLQPCETGWLSWKFRYAYKNGKFQLKSSVATVKSSLGSFTRDDGYDKYFKKNQFVASKKLTFYTSVSQKKKSFTAKKKSVLTLKKICVKGDRVYLKFQLGKKSGWRKVNHAYSKVYDYTASDPSVTGWFYGVYYRLAG